MEKKLGLVTHYYDRIGVAVVILDEPVSLGDLIRFHHPKGVDFSQKVESMELEHKPISSADAGMEVAIKVDQPTGEGTVLSNLG